MAPVAPAKTTYEIENTIEPFYTGGDVSVDQDASLLATAAGEDAVLTDLSTGVRVARVEGDGEALTALILTPDASHLILCSRSSSMRICRISRQEDEVLVEVVRSLKPHSSPVVTLATDRTGTLVATGGSDGIVKVWDIRGGYTTHTLHGHSGVVSALHFFEVQKDANASSLQRSDSKKRKRNAASKDSTDSESTYRLASGSEDGQIRIWNLQKRKCAAVLDSHVSVVRSLEFSDVRQMLLSASRDQTVMLWDAASWKSKVTIPILETIESGGFTQNHNVFYTAGERGNLRLWDLRSGKEFTEDQDAVNESQAVVQALCLPEAKRLVTVHADQSILFHQSDKLDPDQVAEAGSRIPPLAVSRQITGTHDDIIDLAFVGRQQSLLAVAANLEEVRLVSLQSSPPEDSTGSEQSYFGADVAQLKGHDDIIICLDTDWSGHWLATGAKDNSARLWRLDPENNSFTCYAVFTGHAESLGAIALPKTTPSQDSAEYKDPLSHPPRFLVTGSQDKTIKRWDIPQDARTSARAIYTRKAHDKDINAMDIDAKSRLFASASQDRTVKIWSVEDGETAGILRGHKRGVWSVKFSPANTPPISGESGQVSSARGLVVTGSGDKTVKLWNIADYSCLRTFEGHTNSVLKVAWLNMPSGKAIDEDHGRASSSAAVRVASAAGDGLVKVWDVNSGELDCTLDNHTDRVWAVIVHPENNNLVSGGGDSVITFWKDTTTSTSAAAAAASTARVEQDQQLQNYIRNGSYRSAITLALQLNHPQRLLGLFTSVVNKHPPEPGSLSGVKGVDEVLASLGDEQLILLLLRIRDWNTNAKNTPVAQRILWVLLKSYPPSRLTSLRASGRGLKGSNVKDVLDALRAYTERHYRRMEDLIDESYLVEYTLREMDELGLSGVVGESAY